MIVRVHKGYYPFNIEEIEKQYNAKYIGDFSIKDSYFNWTTTPVAIFYVKNPNVSKNHSHYLGIYIDIIYEEFGISYKNTYLINGESAFSEPFNAIEIGESEYAISCFRHDYWESHDKKYMIDGGRDYLRTYENNKVVQLELKDGVWKFINNGKK